MAENEWPKSILFTVDGLYANFGSESDVGRWVAEERAAWNQLAAGGNSWASTMVQNMNILAVLDSDKSDTALRRIVDAYRPIKGALGRFISRIPTPQVRWATFSEILQPGSTGSQQGGDFVQARTLATLYAVIGGNLIAIEQAGEVAQSVRAAVDDVNRLRQSDQELIDRFSKLLLDCDVDWKNKIEGFETRAALSAPRTYWNSRSESHGSLAVKDRRAWFWSVWALVTLILAVSVINFMFPPPSDIAGEVGSTVQRLVIFGSLLAVAVWWLRQKLRDVRMHEHFSEDAAERATMIETYAAMRGDGLQDKDLNVILAALYRPATGNLADDLGPVLPTEAIWRAIGDFASRRS